jgi:hypothetical protein
MERGLWVVGFTHDLRQPEFWFVRFFLHGQEQAEDQCPTANYFCFPVTPGVLNSTFAAVKDFPRVRRLHGPVRNDLVKAPRKKITARPTDSPQPMASVIEIQYAEPCR